MSENNINTSSNNIPIQNPNLNPYEGSKLDLNLAKHQVVGVINSIEDTIYKKEEQRDYKMKSNFLINFF